MKKLIILTILFLQAVCFSAPAEMCVTFAGGAAPKDGSDWDHAMGIGEFETDIENNMEAGDIYWIKGGTEYYWTQYLTVTADASSALPTYIIGVKSTTTNNPPNITIDDYAYDDDRPVFYFPNPKSVSLFIAYLTIKNMRFIINHQDGVRFSDSYITCENCTFGNPYSGADSSWTACTGSNHGKFIACDFNCTNGIGAKITSFYKLDDCNFWGSYDGLNATYGVEARNCFFWNNTTGMNTTSTNDAHMICNNVFYNNSYRAIHADDSGNSFFKNNIFLTNGVAACWDSQVGSNLWEYNLLYNNTTDRENVPAFDSTNITTADPCFMDAANGDFRLKAMSPCWNNGKPLRLEGSTNIGYWTGSADEVTGDILTVAQNIYNSLQNDFITEEQLVNDINEQTFGRTGITEGGTWTFEKIIKLQTAYQLGEWQDKSGETGVYQILDAEDQTTPIIDVNLNTESKYKEITIP